MTDDKIVKQVVKRLTTVPVPPVEGCCPVCGCGDLEYYDCNYRDDWQIYTVGCPKCSFRGDMYSEIKFYGYTGNDGEEYNIDD